MIVRVRGLIPHDGKFLFVEANHDHPFWCLPGGKVEPSEAIVDAFRREIVEELGVEPAVGRLLYVYQFYKGDEESLEFFFEVTNGADYQVIDLSATSHGSHELLRTQFMAPSTAEVRPPFIRNLQPDDLSHATAWPLIINNLPN